MKKAIILLFLVLSLFQSSCDAQSRRRGEQRKEEPVVKEEPKKTVDIKPMVNVYIENSGSMDGFVKGITEFKGSIAKLLAKLKFYYDEENVKVFFIRNDRPQRRGGQERLNVVEAFQSNISDYVSAIDLRWKEDRSFRGHNTNLNNIFKEMLNRTNDTTISILFSDCIYSIGSGGAENMLNSEKGTTYSAFLDYAKKNNGNLATTILKMKSKFDGNYYPFTGDKNAFSFKGELPYYICVMANQDILSDFNKSIKLGDLEGYDSKYILAHSTSTNPYFSVLMSTEKKGRFKQQRKLSSPTYVHGIEDVKLNKRSDDVFMFGVAISIGDVDIDDAYLLDTSNYTLSEDCFRVSKVYKIKKEQVEASDWLRIKDGNPTHIVVIEAKNMRWSNVELGISLKKQVPQWIEKCSILDDTKADNLKGGKSFGLKYWIEGISEAYEELYPNDVNYFEVTVKINK